MKIGYSFAILLALSACGGTNPLQPASTSSGSTTSSTSSTTSSTTGTGISGSTSLPPAGVPASGCTGCIVRYEAYDATTGSGYATNVVYSSGTDTFTVQNLPFVGNNVFSRDTVLSGLGADSPYGVYESPATYTDSQTGKTINQFNYRAIYAVSPSGKTQFAIVRTGDFADYGFGGFVYQRNGAVTLPTSGQAIYSGKYAGLIDYSGATGINYTSGDMTMAVDFNAFNTSQSGTAANAVTGSITNRKIFDTKGNNITSTVLANLSAQTSTTVNSLPVLTLKVGPGVMNANGEVAGQVASPMPGSAKSYESGTFYAVLADNPTYSAGEVVGIITVTSQVPQNTSVTARETGGFILQR